MDYGSLLLTIILVTVLVATLGWIGDWSGSRMRQRDDRFWLNSGIRCPDCNRTFSDDDILSRGYIISERKYFGSVVTCPSCHVAFEFFRGDHDASYVGPSTQFRRCLTCDDTYNGIPGDRCPACGSDNSVLGRDSPFGIHCTTENIG